MGIEEWLIADELVVPVLMIFSGVASLGFHGLITRALEKHADRPGSRISLDSLAERFASRRKVSWVLMAVGGLWLSLGIASEVLAAVLN